MKPFLQLPGIHLYHSTRFLLAIGLALAQGVLSRAATLYVDVGSASPNPPFSTWQTASRTIQDAVDLAAPGDLVLVTNGVYATGRGSTAPGSTLTNRVYIAKPITVRSVNGALHTTIEGYQTSPRWGDDSLAVRAVYLANGAEIEGFTITKGDTRSQGAPFLDQAAGGVFCVGFSNIVRRCIIRGNVAYYYAAGAFGGRLENCLVIRNSATNGASGVCSNILVNCTVAANGLGNGPGGAQGSRLYNSIVWQNSGNPLNHRDCVMNYSCADPLPATGAGNINADPLFENPDANLFRTLANSPCIDKGSVAIAAMPVDLEGNGRSLGASVDMGAYEFGPRPPVVLSQPMDLSARVGQTVVLAAGVEGSAPLRFQWRFAGEPIPWGTNAQLTLTNVQTTQSGVYRVAVTNEFGWVESRAATLSVTEPVTHYVNALSANPVPPYISWDTAAQMIQQAVDAASAGDLVVVTNGIYQSGGRAIDGAMANRVALDKAVRVTSVNGPEVTIIQGQRDEPGTNGPLAVRCAYLADGASLVGFTLIGGATLSQGQMSLTSGGGAWCATNAVISRCIIRGNSAQLGGGGVVGGTVDNCVLFGNTAGYAGGALGSTLRNCTVIGNTAGEASGVYGCDVANSIVISNRASFGAESLGSTFRYSCAASAPGAGNVSLNPRVENLAGGDLRLTSGSPCINIGNNGLAVGSMDVAGNPRVFGSGVDIGAYEYQGAFTPVNPTISLQPTNTAVRADLDALFAVVADGTEPLAYQWRFEGRDLPLKTNSVLVITNVQAADVGVYTVKITNAAGSITSDPAVLTIRPVATLYVNAASSDPQPPFTTWATAARRLQDAADLSGSGDQIVVTNGVYAEGGRADGRNTNRLFVPPGVKVRSLNGPEVTIIEGVIDGSVFLPMANSSNSVRCVWLSDRASLSGFTLTNGAGWFGAGGVHADSSSVKITNCILAGNVGSTGGGGFQGSYFNCLFWRNSALSGGGVAWAELNNCTVVDNRLTDGSFARASKLPYSGPSGPGVLQCSANNSIIVYNRFAVSEGVGPGSFTNCCLTPDSYFTQGAGNFTADPMFMDRAQGDFRLQASSPCIDAGNTFRIPGPTDLAGQPRVHGAGVDVGAYEFQGTPTPLPVGILQQPRGARVLLGDSAVLQVVASGTGPFTYQWRFNGTPLPEETNAALVLTSIRADQLGTYTVGVTGRSGSTNSDPATISLWQPVPVHYVDASSANPIPPYDSWATAARVIQDAVDVAADGDLVLVTNGVYATGGKLSAGESNRVHATRPIAIRSVNGPRETLIEGYKGAPGYSSNSVRCVYLVSGASLSGFTLTNGASRTYGGGAYCETRSATLTNCIIRRNEGFYGGGASGGTLYNCLLFHNTAYMGGGAANSLLMHCTVTANGTVPTQGVRKLPMSYQTGAGVADSACLNSIIYGNTFYGWPNENYTGQTTFTNCCTSPVPLSAIDTIDANPLFLKPGALDFHLAAGSPCINTAATLLTAGNSDLDGLPRVVGLAPDIGAYEFQGSAALSLQDWLARYGLPGDGSADYLDSDGDGANNWQEWKADTIPTNPNSALRLLPPTLSGNNVIIQWQGSPGLAYTLERNADPNTAEPFEVLATNLTSTVGTYSSGSSNRVSFTDTNAAASPMRAYRLRVGK